MTAAVFDLNEDADEERLLDWLWHYLYATHAVVRELVDRGVAPPVRVHLSPEARFCPSAARLFVSIEDGMIMVRDDWAAAPHGANEERRVREIFGHFGFSTEERAAASDRAEKEHVEFMQGTS